MHASALAVVGLSLLLAPPRTGSLQPTNSSLGRPVSLQTAASRGVPVRIIRVDLRDPRVHIDVQLASGFPGAAEDFGSMVGRSRPVAAVNGAYFSKDTLAPIGDLVVSGRLRHRGLMGTALAITSDNRAVIRRVTWGHAEHWEDYRTVLACGPALVLGGRIDVHPESEGFRDPHVMGSARRMGVGLTPEGCLLVVTTLRPVTFRQWADVMQGLGCHAAMNLDAGASLAMMYRGTVLERPGRRLTNLLLVYEDDGRGTVGGTASLPGASVSSPEDALAHGLMALPICRETGRLATPGCPHPVLRGFSEGQSTPEPCPRHGGG